MTVVVGVVEQGGRVSPEACGPSTETVGMASGRPVTACNQTSCSSEKGGAVVGTATGVAVGSMGVNQTTEVGLCGCSAT